jgi:hypothetical protein
MERSGRRLDLDAAGCLGRRRQRRFHDAREKAMKRAALALLLAAAGFWLAKGRQAPPPTASAPARVYRIVFGETDTEGKKWDGTVEVTGGELASLAGWRFGEGDEISGRSFRLSTRIINLEDQRRGMTEVGGKPVQRLAEAGLVATVRGPGEARVRVTTAQGNLEFSNVPYARKSSFLNGNVTVERVPETELLTDDTYEDDYPAAVVTRAGELWIAWLGYRDKGDVVLARRRGEKPVVLSGPGDHQRPVLAEDGAGRLWAVWSQQEAGAWHLRARRLEGGRWTPAETLTQGEGPNLSPAVAVDRAGALHLVWQGFRQQQGRILLKSHVLGGWSEEVVISEGAGDHWDPSVAADPKGGLWIAWDGYQSGEFQIYARRYGDKPGPVQWVSRNRLFSARPSIAVDAQGRPWIAWEQSGPNWGKDWAVDDQAGTVLYKDRSIRVAFQDAAGQWREPVSPVAEALSDRMRRFHQHPRVAFDSAGRLWMILRVRTSASNSRADYWASGGRWEFYVTQLAGARWTPAVWLPDSAGRNGMRAAVAPGRDGTLWAVWPMDRRSWPQGRVGNHDVYAARLAAFAPDAPKPEAKPLPDQASPGPPSPHPRERQELRRVRDYRYQAGGRSLRIFRADLHRHTELSGDGAGDGSLEDLYRYEMNAADLDVGHVGDHQMGADVEYYWWMTQKSNDLYTVPGRFLALYGYERSVWWPNGHRNVIWAERGHPVLRIGPEEAKGGVNSGPILYPYLKQTRGLATSHTSATEQGTDWRDNDPELEPIVEIYQGFESSYEHAGAPRSWDPQRSKPVHQGQRPEGFVWNAWAKGYKLGVQASSDHVGAHTAYANIIAPDFTRHSLVDAMRRRHTYASTDLIILDFRMDDHLMGDSFTTQSLPRISVKIAGTAPIKQVDLIKNNTYLLTRNPGTEEYAFQYVDNTLAKGESYYYVRVLQSDGELAWSSPIWVRLE